MALLESSTKDGQAMMCAPYAQSETSLRDRWDREPTTAARVRTICPLQPGWRVVYRDPHKGLLDGVVRATNPCQAGWLVHLTNGQTIVSRHIASVTAYQNERWDGSWLVRFHGLDGRRGETSHDEGGKFSNAEPQEVIPNSARAPPKG